MLVLSAWCGLRPGLLEVGTIVVRKRTFDPNQLYEMSRHFVWLIPLTNLCLFLALGVILKLLLLAWPRRVNWLAPRLLCSLTMLPILLVGLPRIHGLAWFVVTLGVAARLVPMPRAACRRLPSAVAFSFPVVVGLVPILAATVWGGDWIKERRQSRQAAPRPGSPNVLLIVLDTVAADHLSLYGYERPTSPTWSNWPSAGFASIGCRRPRHGRCHPMRACSPDVGRTSFPPAGSRPLDRTYPTLAEFLGSRGYATAGFVANYWYCASDSGLDRGFAAYEDYIFPRLTAFKSAVAGESVLKGDPGD